MQQLASPAANSRLARDFAGVLADFTSPPKKPLQPGLDALEDDIAVLSYEQALRNRNCSSPLPAAVAPADPAPATPERCSRRSSITIRLTASEAEQLRVRAAEAGLTVSAYLRSCALEVESLRAEVKSTLAQMRSSVAAAASELQTVPPPQRPSSLRPWLRLFRSRKQA